MKTGTTMPPIGTPINTNHPLSKGLVGCWLLNEGGGQIAFNSANSSNAGTLTNGTTYVTSQKGSCISLDATDDYVPTLNSPISTYPLSLCCWYRLSTTTLFSDTVLLSVVNTTNTNEFWFGWFATSNNLRTVAQAASVNRAKNKSSFPVDTNWHHIIAVFHSTTVHTIFFDGMDIGGSYTTAGGGSPSPSGLNKVGIGGFIYNGSTFYTPSIARNINSVMVYNRIITPNDAKQLYTNTYQMFQQPRPLKLAV